MISEHFRGVQLSLALGTSSFVLTGCEEITTDPAVPQAAAEAAFAAAALLVGLRWSSVGATSGSKRECLSRFATGTEASRVQRRPAGPAGR